MQLRSILISAFVAVASVQAATNEPCYGAGGVPGVCVKTSECSKSGGTTSNGGCPRDAANVKCCVKPKCKSAGNCRWKSDCKGGSLAGDCPGPGQFSCCQNSASSFGGYGAPIWSLGEKCQAVVSTNTKKIVAKFPGRIRQIYCTRGCKCGSGSDHCCGKAADLMCSDGGGVPTASGKEIAEWVMHNAASLHVKYIIWGQKIWQYDGVRSWNSWKAMEDRGDITQNHWDHVHVSFK